MGQGPRGVDLREAFAEHFDAVYDFVAVRLPGLEGEIEDVVQEVFLALAAGRAPFAGRSSLRTWLCAIARRKVIDRQRAAIRAERGARLEAAAVGGGDSGERPEGPLFRDTEAELVRACLAGLPPEARYSLVLRHVEGLSQAEIARILGKSVKATESVLHRARSAFAAAFEEASNR